jgi:hypothetical protein
LGDVISQRHPALRHYLRDFFLQLMRSPSRWRSLQDFFQIGLPRLMSSFVVAAPMTPPTTPPMTAPVPTLPPVTPPITAPVAAPMPAPDKVLSLVEVPQAERLKAASAANANMRVLIMYHPIDFVG